MKTTVLSFLLLLISTSIVFVQGQTVDIDKQTKEAKLENLTISMSILKKGPNGTNTKIDWIKVPITLTIETVSVDANTINELLRRNNISPDTESYGIVYTLNPEIKSLQKIEVAQIKIPKLLGNNALKKLFNQDAMVSLTVDKGLKKQFAEEVKTLNKTIKKLNSLDTAKFVDAGTKTNILDSLGIISNALIGINKRVTQRIGRFVPSEVVNQLNAQTKVLNEELNKALLSNKKLSQDELQKITEVKEDLEIKRKNFSEVASGEVLSRYSDVLVSVMTLKDGQHIKYLRIYYVPKALRNNPQEIKGFGELSSPATQRLPEASYCFWGARDPSTTAVTNVFCQGILDGNGTIPVQLTVIQ